MGSLRNIFIVITLGSLHNQATGKISEQLQSKMLQGETADVMVTMCSTSSSFLSDMKTMKFPTREARLQTANGILKEGVTESQRRILSLLSQHATSRPSLEFKSFTTTNKIFIRNADIATIDEVSKLDEVCSISPSRTFRIINPPEFEPYDGSLSRAVGQKYNSWGINTTGAPDAWSKGYTGKGIRVGVVDTGCRASHEAIVGNIDTEHGWFDPAGNYSEPYDPHGHGTHVTGTIVGWNGIGVAPGALFMSCMGCNDRGECEDFRIFGCLDHMRCPSKDGQDYCDGAPDIISCSWGGPADEEIFNDAIQALWDSGILMVFAAGNSGPACETIVYPGWLPNVITVGATNVDTSLGDYSCRGPTADGRLKPDVAAPGTSILSAYAAGDNQYAYGTGTSMATPHVAGICALLLERYPAIRGKPGAIVNTLIKNVMTENILTSDYCGGSSTLPNNYHGYGVVRYKV